MEHGSSKQPMINDSHPWRSKLALGRWSYFGVEIDGPGHDRAASQAHDDANEAILRARGFTVVRFTEANIEREPRAVIARCAAAAASPKRFARLA